MRGALLFFEQQTPLYFPSFLSCSFSHADPTVSLSCRSGSGERTAHTHLDEKFLTTRLANGDLLQLLPQSARVRVLRKRLSKCRASDLVASTKRDENSCASAFTERGRSSNLLACSQPRERKAGKENPARVTRRPNNAVKY